MAKSTKTTTINDVLYTLHSTKASGTGEAIGYVPVLASNRIEDFIDVYDESFVVACCKQGIAIALQAKARRACVSDKITTGEFNTIASQLLSEDIEKYAGNFAQLQKDVNERFEQTAEDRQFDDSKIWTEYANG